MTDNMTPRLALPLMAAGQAQKEVTHNEALQALDAAVQCVAQSASLTAPPSSPGEGLCWIVATGATGAWAGHDGALAQWTAGGWRFLTPAAGWHCHVLDAGCGYFHDGAGWAAGQVRNDGIYVSGMRIVGPRQPAVAAPAGGSTVDAEARSAISALLAAVRTHGLIAP